MSPTGAPAETRCMAACVGKIRLQGLVKKNPDGTWADDPKNPLHYLIRQRQVALPLYPQFGTEPNGYYIPPRWVPRSYLIQMLVQALFSDLANVGYWSPVAARNLFHLPPGHNRRRRAPPLLAGTYTMELQDTGGAVPASITLNVIPEPSSLILAAFGLIGLAAWQWRRR